MVVLRKKRIKNLTLICLIALSVAVVKSSLIKNENVVSTASVPATNKVIIIDAGHGNPDGGAVSDNGVCESDINLEIALKLQNLLEQNGSTVILTRSDENSISSVESNTIKSNKVSDLKNRCKIGNESSADIFVSIHLNKISDEKCSGWQTFYKSSDENSIELASKIQENLDSTFNVENKRAPAKLDNIYIMKNVEVPISIVECGFLSNKEEEQKLQDDDYQNKLAWGIYGGILDYFK